MSATLITNISPTKAIAGGIAIIVDALTDNKNRTAANVRSAFTKGNGKYWHTAVYPLGSIRRVRSSSIKKNVIWKQTI